MRRALLTSFVYAAAGAAVCALGSAAGVIHVRLIDGPLPPLPPPPAIFVIPIDAPYLCREWDGRIAPCLWVTR